MGSADAGEGVREVRAGDPVRECRVCGEVKPLIEFLKSKPKEQFCHQCRECRRARDKEREKKRSRPAVQGGFKRVPVGPFREWVLGLLEEERQSIEFSRVVNENRSDGAHKAVAFRLGIPERAIWRVLNEAQSVTLDFADRAVVNYGDPHLLNEMYPVEEE